MTPESILNTAALVLVYLLVYSPFIVLLTILCGGSYWLWRIEKLIKTKIPTRLDSANKADATKAGRVVSIGLRAKSELGD